MQEEDEREREITQSRVGLTQTCGNQTNTSVTKARPSSRALALQVPTIDNRHKWYGRSARIGYGVCISLLTVVKKAANEDVELFHQ